MALCEIIKYEGDSNTLVYKFPEEDFNTFSQLIVHESQEAILFKDGQMCDTFGPGKYTMHTGNIPILNKLVNLSTGGESPFHCEVYFVNKALALDYNWGTSSQALVMDQTFQLLLHVGASGVIGIKINDPRKLMVKIVGTESQLTAEQCLRYFRENVSAKVKQYIAKVMQQPGMSFITLDTQLLDFSAAVKERLAEDFSDVGIDIYDFIISAIKIPTEEYEVITAGQRQMQQEQYNVRSAQFEKQRRIIAAEGEAAYREIQGYNWTDEQKAEIAKAYAANEGAQNSPAGMFAQAPAALMFGNMLSNNMGTLFDLEPKASDPAPQASGEAGAPSGDAAPTDPASSGPAEERAVITCPQCGAQVKATAKFCSECGTPLAAAANTCKNCGSPLEPGAKFCSECGTKI